MILSMAYGYDVEGPDDRKIYVVKKLTHIVATTSHPGALLVNNLSFRACFHHVLCIRSQNHGLSQ